LSDAQKCACVEAAKERSRILQELETNDFDGVATGDEFWFQHITASAKMFARSAADVIPMLRQAIGAKKTMTTAFFTAKNLLCSRFVQETTHSISYISSMAYSPI
jgi:hypothetical protein